MDMRFGFETTEEMGRTLKAIVEDDYETQQRKQAAADVLYQYSRFAMVCIGEGVRPTDLRLHLMKEVSGMPTSLKKEPSPGEAFPEFVDVRDSYTRLFCFRLLRIEILVGMTKLYNLCTGQPSCVLGGEPAKLFNLYLSKRVLLYIL